MSLKIWLPMTGDLYNQGISSYNITSTDSSVVDSGKIGKCMKITKSTNLQYTPDFNNKGLSFGGWFKFNQSEIAAVVDAKTYTSTANSPVLNLIGNNNYGGIGLILVGNNHYTSGTFSSLSVYAYLRTSSINQTTSSMSLSFDTWTHIMLTWDPVTRILATYKDGILFSSKNVAEFSNGISRELFLNWDRVAGGNGPATNMPMYCNDVRIYDHCLSAAEVKEIAQGLVLHYPLNRQNLKPIGTNLVTGITKGGQTSLLTDERVGVVTSGTNGDTYFTINLSETITSGTTYYFSCDVSGVSEGQYWGFPLGAQSNTSMPSKFYNGHNEYIFTANDINWGTNRLFLDDNYRNDYAHPASFYNFVLIKNPTFIATDGSGFGHNGISNAPITTSEDTSRYEEASYFGAYNTPVLTVDNFSSIAPALTSCTITWWGKYDTSKTLLLTGQSTNHYIGASNNNNYYHGNAGSPVMYKDGVSGTYKCAADGWHFFALTGVNISTWTTLKINGYGSRWPLNGYISDFRIYCTPLLDTDIKQLYNVSMKVDKEQNVHTFEGKEQLFNIMYKSNFAIGAQLWQDGLNRYTQANCQVNLTDDGLHIYRPANLNQTDNGSTMYGGLKIVNSTTDNIHSYNPDIDNIFNLQKGHTYVWIFHIKGNTTNAPSFQINNNMGWGGGGLVPAPSNVIVKNISSNFSGETEVWYKFTINDEIVKTCTSAYSSFVANNQYLSYKHFGWNWGYGATGNGTDIYITNIRLYDITNIPTGKIMKNGIIKFSSIFEANNTIHLTKNEDLILNQFIER